MRLRKVGQIKCTQHRRPLILRVIAEDKVTLFRMTIMWQMLFPFVSRLSGSAPLYNLNEELKVTKEGEEEEETN